MEEDSVNYAEYTVDKKPEGTNLKKRLGLIALYVAVMVAIVIMVSLTHGGAAVWGGVLFVLLVALVWFTWRLVKEERKYEIANAKLRITEQNASGKGKVVSEELVSSYALIAPMNDEYKNIWSAADEVKDYRGDTKSPDSYFALSEKDGKNTIICFEVTNKMLKTMKFYNKATVITEVRR